MSDILKGNFKPQRDVEVKQEAESLENQFEREAMKRLGGSIAFVSKHKVMWGDEATADATPAAPAPDKPET